MTENHLSISNNTGLLEISDIDPDGEICIKLENEMIFLSKEEVFMVFKQISYLQSKYKRNEFSRKKS